MWCVGQFQPGLLLANQGRYPITTKMAESSPYLSNKLVEEGGFVGLGGVRGGAFLLSKETSLYRALTALASQPGGASPSPFCAS